MTERGSCIVCGAETADRSWGGGAFGMRRYWHWRCADLEECAVRRNARKRRPRLEAAVRAESRAIAARDAAKGRGR
jgi:hypothetical protein